MMQQHRLILAFTVVNIAILGANVLTLVRPAHAQDAQPSQQVTSVVRAHSLEIVDDQGRVRASIAVHPASASGVPETVLLRLITERGRPSVKLSASEQASGASFAGPTGTRETYSIIEAKGTESAVRLRNETGREYVVKPQ